MTTKVKKKKDYKLTKEQQKYSDQLKLQRDLINEQLQRKDYILTVYQMGDKGLSNGDRERQVDMTNWYVVCSLEEIPNYIKKMKTSFWYPPEGLSEKEKKDYPFEKKKWGRYLDVVIEPFSKDMEENYLNGSKEGFFERWREVHKREEELELPEEQRSI